MSERITTMKRHYINKTAMSTHRGYEQMGAASSYRPELKISLERARLLTESYKQTEGQFPVARKAAALAHILHNMRIYIEDGQLIVGNYAETRCHLPFYPESAMAWINQAANDGLRDMLDDAGRQELATIAEYWKGRSVQGKERHYLPDDLKPYWRYNGAIMLWFGHESGLPNYEKLFRVGLNGLIEEAKNKLSRLSDLKITANEYVEQSTFLKAAIASMEGGIDFSRRFAALAREMAQQPGIGTQRQRELEQIAENCDRVPANPPETFWQAAQFFWFIHLITHAIELFMNGCGARLDQLFYPFYKNDKEQGTITREKAQEVLECLFLKLDDIADIRPPITIGGSGAAHPRMTITLGGLTPTGEDATNEVTFLLLDAADATRLPQPSISIRCHKDTPKDLLLRAIDLVRTGVGYPAFFNDEYEIPMLTALGIPIEDARNWGNEACMRWTISGKNICCRAVNGHLILPKFLELALTRGWDKFSSRQLGPITRDPLAFTSIDDVVDAYVEQTRFFVEKLVRINNFIDVFYLDLVRPFLTPLLDDGIEKSRDCRQWTYFYKTIFGPIGCTTLADSLAAIKKLVFEEKRVSMAELLDALKNNWEGKEDLRQLCLNAPKFGNDDDYVDLIAHDVITKTRQVVESFTNYHGFRYLLDGSSGATYYSFSGLLGATSDGRKDKEYVNDGTISPASGRDKRGPTAVLNSVSKVKPLLTFNQLLNQKFLPQFLQGQNRETFAAYLRGWVNLGIHHVQFNVVSADTLRQAQQHPEQFQQLVVRVAGYSAFFVDLTREMQEEIIKRTEHAFC